MAARQAHLSGKSRDNARRRRLTQVVLRSPKVPPYCVNCSAWFNFTRVRMAFSTRPSTQALPESRLRRIARSRCCERSCGDNWSRLHAKFGRVRTVVQRILRLAGICSLAGIRVAVLRKSEQLSSSSHQCLTDIGETEPESRFSGSDFFAVRNFNVNQTTAGPC